MFSIQVFLDKMPNMYANLKKKIEISHLRGSVVMFIHKLSITLRYNYHKVSIILL